MDFRTLWYAYCAIPLRISLNTIPAVNSLPGLIQSHSEALAIYKTLYDTLTKDTTDYEDGKTALEQWRDQGVRGEARKAVEEWEEVISNEMP